MTMIRPPRQRLSQNCEPFAYPVAPARAINPATGKLAATVRLTQWANGIRYQGELPPGRTAIPDLLMNSRDISAKALGLAIALYTYPPLEPPTLMELITGKPDGRDSVLAAVQELVDAGWVEPFYVKARIPPDLRMAVLKRDGFRCVNCDAVEDLMADHVFPESKGGETTFENLQCLCRPCNSQKGSKA